MILCCAPDVLMADIFWIQMITVYQAYETALTHTDNFKESSNQNSSPICILKNQSVWWSMLYFRVSPSPYISMVSRSSFSSQFILCCISPEEALPHLSLDQRLLREGGVFGDLQTRAEGEAAGQGNATLHFKTRWRADLRNLLETVLYHERRWMM